MLLNRQIDACGTRQHAQASRVPDRLAGHAHAKREHVHRVDLRARPNGQALIEVLKRIHNQHGAIRWRVGEPGGQRGNRGHRTEQIGVGTAPDAEQVAGTQPEAKRWNQLALNSSIQQEGGDRSVALHGGTLHPNSQPGIKRSGPAQCNGTGESSHHAGFAECTRAERATANGHRTKGGRERRAGGSEAEIALSEGLAALQREASILEGGPRRGIDNAPGLASEGHARTAQRQMPGPAFCELCESRGSGENRQPEAEQKAAHMWGTHKGPDICVRKGHRLCRLAGSRARQSTSRAQAFPTASVFALDSAVRRLSLFLILCCCAATVRAQELNCVVDLNTSTLQGNEFQYLQELEINVNRYLNDRAWTDDLFENRERIDCSFQITILASRGQSGFSAELVVRASRPIYGTGQRTQTMLIADRAWDFNYTRGQNLIYDPNTFDDLTSVLDFYAMLILGYDYDSFGELAGTPFFEEARLTAELGRARTANGWTSEVGDDRSRYTLISEIMDPAFAPLRRANFSYHFDVLDRFVLDPETAWENALATLASIHELYLQFNRRRYATDVFFASKFEEIADLMVGSPARNEAYALLAEMDAAHLSTYDALVNGR